MADLIKPDRTPGTLADYRALVTIKLCPDCKMRFPDHLEHYDHNGGQRVFGFAQRQWLYIECEGCGYGWALWKLLRRQEVERQTA